MRNRRLLERRGSLASLTIDLAQSESRSLEPSPVHEDILCNKPLKCQNLSFIESNFSTAVEETQLSNKTGLLTRYQLRHLDVMASLSAIYAEFAVLPSPSSSSCEKVAGCSLKNRHTLWPIRETRVKLSSTYKALCGSTDEDVYNSYINANYIMDSSSKLTYIAAEGPMSNTVNEFWLMVFQERTPAIIMVTNLEEKPSETKPAQKKCEKYWPESHASYGNIGVTVLSTSFHGGVQIRHIVLNCNGLEHHTRHIWFTEWLDHCLPVQHINQLLKVIVAMESYRTEYQRLFSQTAPVIVHCSAGIGRTCTFISIAMGVEQLCKTPENIDIFSIVSRLRMQRFGAVQLPGQYVFIYLVLQRMEKILTEFCVRNDQDRFPPCLIFPEAYDNKDSGGEDESSDDPFWNGQVDLLCNTF
ncbi:unnamed protein product [Thelazia callipaeda]|uniref:Protein-tyrosine phosphatase n=1 Tax=Thelazia callipaeda TaxID=103827 RepID=A0A158RBF6_THECL|nr:unnamed protein product [Thelazia callipaeda]